MPLREIVRVLVAATAALGSCGWTNSSASEADGAAAFARVGAANESAGFGMNHDSVSAAEGFRIAGDNLVASALQFLHCELRGYSIPSQPLNPLYD